MIFMSHLCLSKACHPGVPNPPEPLGEGNGRRPPGFIPQFLSVQNVGLHIEPPRGKRFAQHRNPALPRKFVEDFDDPRIRGADPGADVERPADAAVQRIEKHLATERPWRDIVALDADLANVRQSYVSERTRLLQWQEQQAEQDAIHGCLSG